MWLYELRGRLRPGIQVNRHQEPVIATSIQDDKRLVVPLCPQLKSLLSHPDDERTTFFLRYGNLTVSEAEEVVLTMQRAEEALEDNQALLLVGLIADKWEGEQVYYEPTRASEPIRVHHRVVIFRPGDGVRLVHQTSWMTQVVYDLRWDWRRRWLDCWQSVRQWGPAVAPAKPLLQAQA